MFQCSFSSATHVGLERDINQDRLLALPEHRVWVIADGMGGHNLGDFAAQSVVDSAAEMALCQDPYKQAEILRKSLVNAHGAVRQESVRSSECTIGASVVALLVADTWFLCYWAGDSRLYRMRNQNLELLTSDHSLVADLVALGELSWGEATNHPQSNIITRAVGVGSALELDAVEGAIQRGDRFLLCSDGLVNSCELSALCLKLSVSPIAKAADNLVELALNGGAGDNVSVIAIETA